MNSRTKHWQIGFLALGLALSATQSAQAGNSTTSAPAVIEDATSTEWAGPGRTPSEQRFSPLKQLSPANIQRLRLAWHADLHTFRGVESTPLFLDGVLYNVSAWDITTAYDATNGKVLWTFDPKIPVEWSRIACCGPVSRGIAAADGKIFVEEPEAAAKAVARDHYGTDEALRQDEDVLDTWFSSALWPFSTLGWPEDTADVRRFYPTSTLVTGFDIIFFWVARMMMMGIHFMDDVPFDRVFINALVRDASGAKMSKSKGNVMDPLDLVDEYGADALRFTLTAMSGQARDIKLSTQRIEGYRNFGTKLWNAARFSQMNECQRVEGFDPAGVQQVVNRWIRGETAKTAREVTAALEACAFDDVAGALYRFIWNVFCDWYLELAKPIFGGADEAAKAETRAMTAWVLDECLKMLHPVSPFLTEELWQRLGETGPARTGMLITTAWPDLPASYEDTEAAGEIGWLVDLVSEIRSIRAEMNVPGSAKPPLTLSGAEAATRERLARHRDLILSLARVSSVEEADAAPAGAVPFVIGEATAALAIAEFIDLAAERGRLTKEIAALDSDIERTAKKLGNADFIAKAREEVVEENRERLAAAEAAKAKLQAALARLESVA